MENCARVLEEAREAERFVRVGGRLIGGRVITDKGQELGAVDDYESVGNPYALIRLPIAVQSGFLGNALAIEAHHVVAFSINRVVVPENSSVRQDRISAPAKRAVVRQASHEWNLLIVLRRLAPGRSG